jgi:uncharacterized heparinase superfamily protein
VAEIPAKRRSAPLSLYPEIARAALLRLLAPLRALWRRTWLYRSMLGGPLADRIPFHPYDAQPRNLEDADALLRGRFRFAGETVDVKDGSIFDSAPPSQAWAESLHAFAWLPPLATAGGDAARTLATNLITQWIKRNARYTEPAWLPHVMAARLVHLFAHGRLAIANSDLLWRSKLFVSLREQSRLLARVAEAAPDGLPRLQAAAGLALSGVCLEESPKRLEQGVQRLIAEVSGQILPDGGHASRSPQALVDAYLQVVMVVDALAAKDLEVPQALISAHDRMAPMIRFFRHADGGLALFNGSGEGNVKTIEALLARDQVRGQPFAHARHSGYHRLAAAKTLVIFDTGAPPDGAFSNQAHAGCLAFELSAGGQRLVVNCGAGAQPKWNDAMRVTAAHSTVTVADTSQASVLGDGFARDLIGARLLGGPAQVDSRRIETAHGWSVEAHHDAYVPAFGILHERRLTLSPQGLVLTGADRLVPRVSRRGSVPFAVRFHIHPDVRMSPSENGGIILKLPTGEGWRFRAGGGEVAIEESVYLGGESVRRAEQLVVTGTVKDAAVEIGWVFEQIGIAAPVSA